MPASDSSLPEAKAAADEVLRQYEDAPYPCSDELVFSNHWTMPSLAWMEALGCQARSLEEPGVRILVAGCGTGQESFAIAKRFPEARVVGMDFSPRSVELARQFQAQRAGEYPHVEFSVGDLTDPALPAALGEPFDFVSCQGVLTYIPAFADCFPVLRACVAERGVCYLGVNGSLHDSIKIRGIFQRLGLDPTRQADSDETRARLAALDRWRLAMLDRNLRDAVANGRITISPVSEEPWPYLSSDVFGAHINNLPLETWLQPAEAAGLHFLGSAPHYRHVNSLMADNQLPPEMRGLPEGELYRLAAHFAPVSFHQLLLTSAPVAEAPWSDPVELLRWRPWRNPRMDAEAIHELIGAGAVPVNVAKGLEDLTSGQTLVGARTAALILAADGQRTLRDLLAHVGLNPAPAPELGDRIRKLSLRCLLRLLPPS